MYVVELTSRKVDRAPASDIDQVNTASLMVNAHDSGPNVNRRPTWGML